MTLALLTALLTGGPAFAQDAPTSPAVQAEVPQFSLNEASAEQLASLDRVDLALAEQVVTLRSERGRLNSVEELRVLDIQEDSLNSLRSGTAVGLTAATSGAKNYKTVDEVLTVFDGEPSVQAVQQMAMDYTHTNRELVEKWMRASRNANKLPDMRFRYYYYNDFETDWTYETGARELEDEGTDDRHYVLADARWELDKIIMSSEQIRVISESQDVVKLRDKVLGEITRLYFDRRRLQVDMLLNSGGDLREQVENQLRLMELTAELDAYTGGQFSAALARSGG